jgi:O-antigen/teichoic acid export membrane protein
MSTAVEKPTRTLLNLGLSGACNVVSGLGSLVTSVIIARSLGAPEMGIYAFVLWVAGTIAALSSLGLPDAISKFVAEHRSTGDHARAARFARTILLVQIMAAGTITVIGACIWPLLAGNRSALIFLALATVIPGALQQTLLALMEGAQRFDLQAIATFIGTAFQVGAAAVCAFRHVAVQGFLIANLVSSVALILFTFILSHAFLSANGRQTSTGVPVVRQIMHFSLSVYALWLLNLVVFDKSELIFLRYFHAPAELAYYSIAFGLTARIAGAGDTISYVLFPTFVGSYAQNDMEGLRAVFQQTIRYLQAGLAPLFIWCIPLAPRIVRLLYGAQYGSIVPVLQVLLATVLITLTMTISTSVLFAMDAQRSLFRFMAGVAVFNILLDLTLIPRFGAVGAACANGLSQAIALLGRVGSVRRALPGSFPIFMAVKTYAAAILSAGVIFYFEAMKGSGTPSLCISILVAALLYLMLLGAMKIVTRSDLQRLRSNLMLHGFGKAS